MKKYIKRVARRLELPKNVKDRVMSDFVSSIEARREAGQTDEEIMAELGAPRKAAEDLNQQMKEYTYRKSPWRFAFLALAVAAGLKIMSDILPAVVGYWVLRMYAYTKPEAASVGIIGGADGPTAIFITAPEWTGPVLALALMVVGIAGYILLKRQKQK